MSPEQTQNDDLPIDEDGTIHVPTHHLPLSAALSPSTRAALASILHRQPRTEIPRATRFTSEDEYRSAVDAFRAQVDIGFAKPMSERLLAQFPVLIARDKIGGVPVEEFTPADGPSTDCVLINLHGGAFCAGAIYGGRVESIPLAHIGRFRILSADYRQGYEHKYPAASEDIAALYTELLKSYAPGKIGIYGGSAGGVLTAQATAWILQHGLPAPGAIGIFGAGTGGRGDSDYFAAIGSGKRPPLAMLGSLAGGSVGYFSSATDTDPLVNPIIAPESFRARFPPSLLITGTRAFDMSPAIATHRALAQAGVDASLHVFDGLGHCFYYDATSPEGTDAYQTMTRFFHKHLEGHTASA